MGLSVGRVYPIVKIIDIQILSTPNVQFNDCVVELELGLY